MKTDENKPAPAPAAGAPDQPDAMVAFTVRLPPSVAARLRAHAAAQKPREDGRPAKPGEVARAVLEALFGEDDMLAQVLAATAAGPLHARVGAALARGVARPGEAKGT